jgi:hypothetical protein
MPNHGAPLRSEIRMTDGWKVLEAAIPRGDSDAVGAMMGCGGRTVRSWCSEPESDENFASGRRSPLDHILQLINAVYARNPDGAERIVDRIVSEIASLRQAHGRGAPLTVEQAESKLREMGRQLTMVADVVAGSK